ncbi:MAG: hypothetical protein NZ805_13750 [Armatimonadetes bacterium]|nr:hypothetical protein [Armatimonadota bacterium]MDW8027196.1 hypothetical protein [Armatimonadota bacterium]
MERSKIKVINWANLVVSEREILQALSDAQNEVEFLKRLVVSLLRQHSLWEGRSDCVELFSPSRRYKQGEVAALPFKVQDFGFHLWKVAKVISVYDDENPAQGQFQVVQFEGEQQKYVSGINGSHLIFRLPQDESEFERASTEIVKLHFDEFKRQFPFIAKECSDKLKELFRQHKVCNEETISHCLEEFLRKWSQTTKQKIMEWLLFQNGFNVRCGADSWASKEYAEKLGLNREIKRQPLVPRIRDETGERDLSQIESEAEDEVEDPLKGDFGEEQVAEQDFDPMLTMSLQDWRNLPPPTGPIKLPTLTYQHIVEAYFPLDKSLYAFFPPGKSVRVEIELMGEKISFWVNREDKSLKAFETDRTKFSETLRANGIPAGTYLWLERIDEFRYRIFARALRQERQVKAKLIWMDERKQIRFEEIDFPMRYEGNPYLVISELRFEDLEALWKEAEQTNMSILTAICKAFEQIDPERKGVHHTELFNAVFFNYRCCSPKTVLSLLYRYCCFERLGNGKWRYEPNRGKSPRTRSYQPKIRILDLPELVYLGQEMNFRVHAQLVREVTVSLKCLQKTSIQISKTWLLDKEKDDIPFPVRLEQEGIWYIQVNGTTKDGRKLQKADFVKVVLPLPKPVRWAISQIEREHRFKDIVERWLGKQNLSLDAIKQRYRRG